VEETGAGAVAPRRVADHAGVVAHDEYDMMPEILEAAKLAEADRD
jgi:hypothetical protein